jgi:hypothetical protein
VPIILAILLVFLNKHLQNEASAREIATCKQNVGQKEDFMHLNFQMDLSLSWIDAAITQHLKRYLNRIYPYMDRLPY